MNPELHSKWNAARDPDRGSSKEARETPPETTQRNKITLKQNKPR